MKLFYIFKNIISHPLNQHARIAALLRFFKWQVASRLIRNPVVFPFIGNSVLVIEKGMAGATGNIYNGLHEYQDMLFALHFLRENDFFVDVGANVGTYTILASVNGGARVVSFEPIAQTFKNLRRNVLINNMASRVELINKAAASEIRTIQFTTTLDAGNHVISEGEPQLAGATIECTTLDEVLKETPYLIKIDVEGFETEVIQGGSRIFSQKILKAIIIELNGSGKRYGFDEEQVHKKLLQFGFYPYSYDPFTRELKLRERWGTHNSIYIRDLDFVMERIVSAPRIVVNNLSL
jgi:FkbM family methyltransferase